MRNYRYLERRNRMLKRVGNFVGVILGAIILAYIMVHFCIQTAAVGGESMQPSYSDGDVVLVNKLAYHLNKPDRYDVALIKINTSTAKEYSVKRVIGLPGETVQIINEEVLVDGKPISFHFDENVISAGIASYPVKLGQNEYFVMGDNCINSEDSRSANIGNIKRSQFIGKVSTVMKKSDSQ